MSQQRPPLFKTWRVFLDICDEFAKHHATILSSTQLAEYLHAKYVKMSADEKERHFGVKKTKPKSAVEPPGKAEDKFPAPATVLRYLNWIEEDLSAYVPERFLIHRSGDGLRRPSDGTVQLVREIGKGLFRQLRSLAEKASKRTLYAAASDSVNAFFFPRVDVRKAIGEEFRLLTRPHHVPNELAHLLLTRDIDLSLGWYEGGSAPAPLADELREQLNVRDVAGSECSVHVLFNPQRSELRKKKRDHFRETKDPDGHLFALTPEDLKGSRLLYPNLNQMIAIGKAFESKMVADADQIEHFASIVYAVRANTGIGLFFGYPWVLRELERVHSIASARLDLPAEWKVNTVLKLKAITRQSDDSPVTQAATQAADRLVSAVEAMLNNHGWPVTLTKPEWRLKGKAVLAKDAFGKGKVWYVRYVTGGEYDRFLWPHWHEGWIDFKAPPKDATAFGHLHLGKSETKSMDVWVDKNSTADGFLMLRFRGDGKGEVTHTHAYFPAQIVKDDFHGTCYLGTLNYSVSNRPFAAPIVLCDRPLDTAECKSIARSHILEFLDGEYPEE